MSDVDRDGDHDVIRLDHVRKEFGSFVAVDEADFGIRAGEFFAMLGPSGCGKTTTLKMIAGFELPTSGRVLLEGQNVSTVPPHKRNVNTVFQNYALFPHMTVADNVAFGPRSKKLAKSVYEPRVAEMLDVVRLSDFANRKPSQLSGGQQQRVALARALVNLPSALLLDEPLAALDLKLREAMQLELKRIQREVGITFVFVTHDQSEALTMSDRIAVMSAGRVEQIGTPEQIYHSPASLFVAGFIGSANLLAGTIAATDGDDAIVELRDGNTMRARTDDRLQSGTRVSVMLRPERLTLVDAEVGNTNDGRSLTGTCRELIFQGPTTRLELELGDGTLVVAQLVNDGGSAMIAPGAPVTVAWAPGAAFVVEGWAAETDSIEAAS